MEEELSHEAPTLSKPPISRSLREKTQRRSNDRSTGPSAPGSLDRRRHPHLKREERDQKSRSSHVKSPPRLDDFQSNLYNSTQNGYCCPPPYEGYFESFHRSHERSDPQRYGSSPMLMEHREHRFSDRGSHPDIYGDCSRYRHEMPCCAYHLGPPPCYFYGGERGYHWTPPPFPKPGEQDEKLRKVQYEKDSLQLQVQVLTEQIEAQSDKISDLEKTLQEKKTLLSDAEETLQRVNRRCKEADQWDQSSSKCVTGGPIEILPGNAEVGTAVTYERTQAELCIAGTGKFGAEKQPV
ncbi:hypothetical protein YQE_04253, partial [Dendroctonus ponderosae]